MNIPERPLRSPAAVVSIACAICVAAAAQTRDPAAWRPTPEGLRTMPEHYPAATVERGADVYALERGEPLAQGGDLDLEAYNRNNGSTGMVVLHRGRIVYEGYWQGADAESRFNSWSMAKSFTGTLIGLAEHDGFIESLDDPIVRYVPDLAETAYREVTIEQALQMSSGVKLDSTEDEIKITCLALPPGPLFVDCDAVRAEFGDLEGFLLAVDEQAAPPGTQFHYSTADTQVLAWVLANAVGMTPAEYLSEKIWQPLGMEDDAQWLLDGPGGMPLAGMGLNARLRDFARFGLLMLNDGMRGDTRILPEGWVARATIPSKPYLEQLPEVLGYQYQWWVIPDGLLFPNGSGAFEAQGAQGQFLHVDPQHELVVAMTSAWPGPTGWDVEKAKAFHGAVKGIVRALGYE